MNHSNKQGDATRSVFMSSVHGLANTLAVVVTFFLAPLMYGRTIYWVQSYTASNYGNGLEDLVALVWGCVCAALVFFVSRASISTALVMGGLALATRFL